MKTFPNRESSVTYVCLLGSLLLFSKWEWEKGVEGVHLGGFQPLLEDGAGVLERPLRWRGPNPPTPPSWLWNP